MEVIKGKVGMPRGLVVGSALETEELQVGLSEVVYIINKYRCV